MPCTAHPRGYNDTKLPFVPPGTINHDPCAKPIVATIAGADVSSSSLCLGHFVAAKGYSAITGAITFGA